MYQDGRGVGRGAHLLTDTSKIHLRRRSQDGGMGGCRAPVSLQLGHLPDSDGRPRCPRRQEEPLSDWVGYRGDWGRGEVEARHSEVWLGNGRGSHAWRDPQRLGGSGEVQWVFSLPIQALGRLLGSWIRSYAFWGPLQLRWAWVWGGKKRRGGWGRTLQDWMFSGGTEGISPIHLALEAC